MSDSTLQKAVVRVLSPLVRMLLRHGVSHAEFASWAKHTYVNEAAVHFGINNKKPSVSRLAIVTGINRKEVKRLLDLPADEQPGVSKHNRAMRVVTGWLQDREFHDEHAEPAILSYGEIDDGFNQLVKRYGGDVPARAMLDELVRVGTVSWHDSNHVELVRQGYVPHESEAAMLDVFATSAHDLLTTLDYNVSGTGPRRLQMSVAYDHVSDEGLREFRQVSRDQAMQLLRSLDEVLSRHDKDAHPQSCAPGRHRTGLGVYFIEDIDSEADGGPVND